MELVLMRKFEHPDVQKPKTSKSTKKQDVTYFCSHFYEAQEQFLFVGLSTGQIFFYKKRNMDSKLLVNPGKDHDMVPLTSPQVHKGAVRKLIYTQIEGLSVLISASADRTIKLWEPKNTKTNKCFQTIIGHTGSILDMVFIQKVQLLVTSSTDKTMRIWRIDKARQLLMYPWFVEFQRAHQFESVPGSGQPNNVWLNCFDQKVGENVQLYAGDSEGSIYIFEAKEDWRESQDCELSITYKMAAAHRISIIQVLLVTQENLIFTISYDQTLKWFETSERAMQVELHNPNKAVYTCLFWDSVDQQLFAADNRGFVYIIDIYEEDKIITKDLRDKKPKTGEKIDVKINSIQIIEDPKFPSRRCLFVHTDFVMKSFRLKKEVKQQNMAGHTGPILKIIALEPSKLERLSNEKIPDTAKVITASLDNSILLWDYEKMDILSRMEAPKNSELTCITFLYRCCLVASGHEDGAIRLWNMEINSSVLLKCQDPAKKHTNTISCISSTVWKESEFLFCGSYDGKISIWEISEKVSGQNEAQQSSTITPQLRHVIDNKKVTQDRNTGSEILVLACYERESEGYVLVGGNSHNLQVYSIRTGLLVVEMEGHTDSVTCMELDANILITGSDDHTIRLWNLGNFTPSGIVGTHQNAVQCLLLIQESGILMSCSSDREVISWVYQQSKVLERVIKNEDILCMEYISEENQLLLGTNTDSGNILTHDIEKFIHFQEHDWAMIEDDYEFEYGEEEQPHEAASYSKTVDINSELDKLMKQQQSILKQYR